MNNSEIFETVLNALPYPNQINDIDMNSENKAIRFTWRTIRFRISNNLSVDVVNNGTLVGSNDAIIFEALLNKTKLIKEL